MTSRALMFPLAIMLVGSLLLVGCGSDDDLSANAGDDFTAAVGESPQFDGCSSDGNIINYAWVIRTTPTKMADDVDKTLREFDEECSFTLETAMVIDEVGSWEIELTVSDADGNTSSDTVLVEVSG